MKEYFTTDELLALRYDETVKKEKEIQSKMSDIPKGPLVSPLGPFPCQFKTPCEQCGKEMERIGNESYVTFVCNSPECVEIRRKAAEARRPFLEKYTSKPITEYGQFDCFVNMEFHEENMFNPDGAGDSMFYGRVEELMDFTGVRVLIGPDIKKPGEAVRCLRKMIDWIEREGIPSKEDMAEKFDLMLKRTSRPNLRVVK